MTLDLKQLTQIQINRELNEVTEGFKEAIDGQFTPLKINTDQTANGVSENIRISAVQGGCFSRRRSSKWKNDPFHSEYSLRRHSLLRVQELSYQYGHNV